MLNVGPGEVLVILVIALVVLGPSRLPGTARAMGRILAKTRRIVTKFQQEMQAAADAPLEALARERGRSEPAATAAPASAGPAEETDGAPSPEAEPRPETSDAR
ncbi:MAG: twin-arginine translocase TatA/TatE family subunit [bacterium]|nr:twin-arginine translocase TatA/TatE family subunit [bacterium]MCY3924809.1 twin-arginine translocase TatA/TatE family subunit [bacterium]